MIYRAALTLGLACQLASPSAVAQMKVDVTSEAARKAAHVTYLDDLSVRDTALTYQSVCVKDDGLYIPGWTVPADLANANYQATGLMLRVEIFPGKRIKGTLVDAAQAQGVAKGRPSEPKTLSAEDYSKAVIEYINRIFTGGFWGVPLCDEERRINALRPFNLFTLDSINGYGRLSDLLSSATGKSR